MEDVPVLALKKILVSKTWSLTLLQATRIKMRITTTMAMQMAMTMTMAMQMTETMEVTKEMGKEAEMTVTTVERQ
jgi:hypothetical protein